jgi:hypothetical protein
MRLAMEYDAGGHLVCTLTDGRSQAVVTTSRAAEALADLSAALDDAVRDGCGECYWLEGGGDYRWMFRRNDENIQVVVLWCTNPVKGWEHVFWSQAPFGVFLTEARNEIGRNRPAAP